MEAFRTCRRPTRIFGCALIVMISFVYGNGQSGDQKVFDAVPEPLRARLVERLSQYTEYRRTKQYEKLYDLSSESTLKDIFRGQISRADFVTAAQRGDAKGTSSRLVEFTPTHTDKIEEEDGTYLYVIFGKAKVCEGGKVIEIKRASIDAQLQNGDWYFSHLAVGLID